MLEAYRAKLTHSPYLDGFCSRMEKCWMERNCSLEPRLREGVGKDVPNQTSLQFCVAQSLWPEGQSQRHRTMHETLSELGPPRYIDAKTELAVPGL